MFVSPTADSDRAPSRTIVLAGVAFATAMPLSLMFFPLSTLLPHLEMVAHAVVGECVFWLIAAILLLLVRVGERRPYSSLGLHPISWSSVRWGLLFALISLMLFPLVQTALKAMGMGLSQMNSTNLKALPTWVIVAMAVRAGVVEELLFRGFLLERLEWLSGKAWVGATMSWALFVVIHTKAWSPSHLIYVGIVGALLTGQYLWRRDLTCNIITHVTTDAIGLLAIVHAAPGTS
jgi:membrane protease YdiL (CAAX protease family)